MMPDNQLAKSLFDLEQIFRRYLSVLQPFAIFVLNSTLIINV